MSLEGRLAEGIATLIATDGIGSWSPSGIYDPAQTGIYVRVQPETGHAITLSTYSLADDPALSDSLIGLQVLSRRATEDPRDSDDLDDEIFTLLQGLHGVLLSTGVRVVEMHRTSGTSLGQDESNRWTKVSSYAVQTYYPTTYRD